MNTVRRMNPNDPNTWPKYVLNKALDAYWEKHEKEYTRLYDMELDDAVIMETVKASKPKAFARYRNYALA